MLRIVLGGTRPWKLGDTKKFTVSSIFNSLHAAVTRLVLRRPMCLCVVSGSVVCRWRRSSAARGSTLSLTLSRARPFGVLRAASTAVNRPGDLGRERGGQRVNLCLRSTWRRRCRWFISKGHEPNCVVDKKMHRSTLWIYARPAKSHHVI